MLNRKARFKHFKDLLHYNDILQRLAFTAIKSILKDLLNYNDISSENSSFDVAAFHIGINDITNK